MYKFIKKKNVYEQIHKYHRGDRSNDGEFEVKQARERKNKKKKIKKKGRERSDGGKAMVIRRGNMRAVQGIGEKIRAAYPVRTKR